MNRISLLRALVLPLQLAFACAAIAADTAASDLLAQLHEKGPSHALERLSRDIELMEPVKAEIARGHADWIAFAAQVYPLATKQELHSLTHELSFAVALALPRAPARVLPLIQAGVFPVDRVCGDIDEHLTPELGDLSSRLFAHLQSVERAVSQFQTQKYSDIREKCLEVVRASIATGKSRREQLRRGR